MNTSSIEDKMIAALEGDLSHTEKTQLLLQIKADDQLSVVWDSYQILYNDLEEVPRDIPSLRVKYRFEKWMEEEQKTSSTIVPAKVESMMPWAKWAGVAAIFLCVFGFWQVMNQNRALESSLAHIESIMMAQSSTERIKAIRVNYNSRTGDVNTKMIGVLLRVLENDKSSNVRLAAVESLSNYMDRAEVREAFIKSISTEADGIVKLEIIRSLGQNQTKEIKTTFEQIVNDDSHEKFVIDGAHLELIKLDTESF